MYNEYLSALDGNKLYFLKSDIDKFDKYKDKFDDYLKTGNLDAAFEIFNIYKKRVGERISYIEKLLNKEFDFTKNDSLSIDRENEPWATTKSELDEQWRLRLKNEALSYIFSGKEWNNAADALRKRYRNFYKMILQYESEDVFSLYMNSYTRVYDLTRIIFRQPRRKILIFQ